MKNIPTRLFYVVDTVEFNREIFTTQVESQQYADSLSINYSIIISEINNWYLDEDGGHNYDDYSDTFNDVITVTRFRK